MTDRSQLKNPKLWERISRTAETVRSLPAWSKGSERNERSDQATPAQEQCLPVDDTEVRNRA
jgi:hypothetical protein